MTEPPKKTVTEAGFPFPFGARLYGNGANFTLFSRHAEGVHLLLFDEENSPPARTLKLNPSQNKTGDIWHIRVEDIKENQLYAFKVEGPFLPEAGHRFTPYRLILDPYARAITAKPDFNIEAALAYPPQSAQKDLSLSHEDNTASMPKCILVEERFDWQNDAPPDHLWSETIIYETHVRGLTVHPSSGVSHPGTYAGVTEKIPYLKSLGITAVELMPVQQFLENEIDKMNPLTGETLRNYWGYNPLLYFTPHLKYAARQTEGRQVIEFKTMVRELHKADIEVILDVVLNHTAEGNERGPTLCYRGIENSIFYLLDSNKRYYRNYSGCGNTLNCNHPVVRDFIIDCLRYWVVEMHVDGFRFDLASVLGRDENGAIMKNPPILERIAEDPILRHTKLIAEAWDAAGVYQVGSFPGKRWAEWNGRYRDDVRRFWRGDPGWTGAFASRLCGSADIYQKEGKVPLNSINFITCHDGFTLNDLVSYNQKHNEANGENNRDGSADNFSSNYGHEGETENPDLEKIRIRQIKNMIATLLISRGVPMLLGGDEFRRTQRGNNNAYCQDNEISWYDWRFLEKNREIYRFVQEMVKFRKEHSVLTEEKFYSQNDILWFNYDGNPPDWRYPGKSFGCILSGRETTEEKICLLFNADSVQKHFVIPAENNREQWSLILDTFETAAPNPLRKSGKDRAVVNGHYLLRERSLALLTIFIGNS
ncbi:glycogen debranching enzyme [bacterium BMS3Abin05]|nr:glycogen debranching enzyme [bacterium BMS3Abin05]